MKQLLPGVILLGAISAFAQSAFEGTWRLNMQSGEFKGHDKYLLQNGVWHCESCAPKEDIKADGKPHKFTGSPYFDTATVNVVNERAIEITREKDGKHSSTDKMTVSDDGKTLTEDFSFVTEGAQEGNLTTVYDRVGEAPAGENKVSGTWRQRKVENASENVQKVTFKVTEDELSMSDPLGNSYSAKLDGKDYPFKGDPGTTSVSLKRINANTIEETDKRNGKVISVTRMTVGADGKTMKMSIEDKLHNQTENWTAEKE